MSLVLFVDPTDATYGLVTSTGLFAGWRSSIDDFSLIRSHEWIDNSDQFTTDTPEAWVIAHNVYNYLGTFEFIPTRDSHPELFL